jgi:hypothetical protein
MLLEIFDIKNILAYIYIMAGRWICSKQREMDLFIEEMAREMYLRDWRRAMLKVHFIIKLKSI